MNEQGESDRKTRTKQNTEAQQKGEAESSILSSPVAFNFPFPAIKMSEINSQLQLSQTEREREGSKVLRSCFTQAEVHPTPSVGILHKHTQGPESFLTDIYFMFSNEFLIK